MKILPIIIEISIFYATISSSALADPFKSFATKQNNNINGLYVYKDTFGIRENSAVGAFSANPNKDYLLPINGFTSIHQLYSYKNRDSVSLYADNTSQPYKKWELIDKVTYYDNGFTTNDNISDQIKPGMLVDTDHTPKWSAYIISINNKRINTTNWINTETGKTGTPPNGFGLKINPITKIWTTNFNVFLSEDGRAKSGVIQENGVVNNGNPNPNEVNGIDTTILPASKFGGTAAYLARSATSGHKQQWLYNYASQGAKVANFISYNSKPELSTQTGYLESSSAETGMTFKGYNKKASVVFYDKNKIASEISPTGQLQKITIATKTISNSDELTDEFARYIVLTSKDIKLNLPSKNNITDGYTLEIDNLNNAKIKFYSSDSKINIFKEQQKISLVYTNNQWYIF